MPLDPVLAATIPFSPGPPLAPGLFMPHARSIGGIVAHVTIEESERDEVTVTEHPVEQGAPISDHAFKRQEEVTIKAGWNLQDGDLSAETGIYGLLLNWQASFIMFDLMTGKRIHHNMLINSMTVVTDQHSEYALMVDLSCREVILTKTQTSSATTANSNSNQADPASTGNQVDRGTQQTTSATAADAAVVTSTVTANGDDMGLP